MAADTLTSAPSSLRTLRIGVALALLIIGIDVVGMLLLGLPNAPVEVNIITSVLAVATIVGAVGAWRGRSWGVWTVALSRAVSALSIVPIAIVPEAPRDALPMSIVIAVLTVVAIVLLFVGRTRR